jgi:hypothetical protein
VSARSMACAALLVAACTSTNPSSPAAPEASPVAVPGTPEGSATPAATRTPPPATPTRVATPTASGGSTPSAAATTAATESAAPSALGPSPSVVSSADPGLGAGTELFRTAGFDDETDWGTGELEGGSISLTEDTLRFEITTPQHGFWSTRPVGALWDVIRADGTLVPGAGEVGGEGYVGFLCGSDPQTLYAGLLGTQGGWVVVHAAAGEVSVLARDATPLGVASGAPLDASFECAGANTGGVRLLLTLAGRPVARYESVDGIAAFDRVGVYVEAATVPFRVDVMDVAAFGGETFSGFPGPSVAPTSSPTSSGDAATLLALVPDAIRSSCTPTVVPNTTALATLFCQPASGSVVAHYALYPDTAAMEAVFERDRVAMAGGAEGGSCTTGPSVLDYDIAGQKVGRLMCYPTPDGSGIAIEWTDTRVNVLAVGSLQGTPDYGALYDWWLEAGPEP